MLSRHMLHILVLAPIAVLLGCQSGSTRAVKKLINDPKVNLSTTERDAIFDYISGDNGNSELDERLVAAAVKRNAAIGDAGFSSAISDEYKRTEKRFPSYVDEANVQFRTNGSNSFMLLGALPVETFDLDAIFRSRDGKLIVGAVVSATAETLYQRREELSDMLRDAAVPVYAKRTICRRASRSIQLAQWLAAQKDVDVAVDRTRDQELIELWMQVKSCGATNPK